MNERADTDLKDVAGVIAAFGGIRPMAHTLDVPVSTVQGWKQRDAIPENRVADIIAAAAAHGVDLSGTSAGAGADQKIDTRRSGAEETVVEISKTGAEAFAVQGDLTKVSEVTRLFDEAVARFGGVDIAINTTGMVLKKPFAEVSEEEYDKIFAINSKAAFFFMQEAGKKLSDGGKLCTIVTSLLGAFTGF